MKDAHEVTVDWGDGTSTTATIAEDGNHAKAHHIYAEPGDHEVIIAVTDDDGGTGSRTTEVSVSPIPVEEPSTGEATDIAD